MSNLEQKFPPGKKVRVTQIVDRRGKDYRCDTIGEVEGWEDAPTGSWFAHGKDDRYWLKRLKLKKMDGEQTYLVVDSETRLNFI